MICAAASREQLEKIPADIDIGRQEGAQVFDRLGSLIAAKAI